ncbi:MAG TPA: hypothetical protein VGN14_15800 [Candidatus Elarobacter sp.]
MKPLATRAELAAGLIAGIAGAILIDLFLFGAEMTHGTPLATVIAQTGRFIASAVMGPSAATNPAAPAIGIVLHFLVSIGWAYGYVYLVRSQPQLLSRPWISGAAFGLVVYIFMSLVTLAAGLYHRPGPTALFTALVAHVLFFGIPVALIVSRRLSQAPARA